MTDRGNILSIISSTAKQTNASWFQRVVSYLVYQVTSKQNSFYAKESRSLLQCMQRNKSTTTTFMCLCVLEYSYLKSLLFHQVYNDCNTAGEVSQNAGVFPFGVRRRLPILNSLSTSTLEGTAVLAFKKIFKILGKSCRFPISAHFMISSSPCPQ